MWKIEVSRWLARRLIGQDAMVCALASWHGWRIRRVLDLIFGRGHCARAADWESRQGAPEPDFLERCRRNGWL